MIFKNDACKRKLILEKVITQTFKLSTSFADFCPQNYKQGRILDYKTGNCN